MIALATNALLVIFAVFTFIWIGRPDKGGVKRCQDLSKLHNLRDFIDGERVLFAWKPFEIRYKFTMGRSKFAGFQEYTQEQGYSTWVDGGGSYGSFEEDSHANDPLYYTSNNKSMKDEWKLFYRPSTEELNVIYFDSR